MQRHVAPPQKYFKKTLATCPKACEYEARSFDNLSVPMAGKSSSELGSLMVRNPIVGNSLELWLVLPNIIKINE